MSPIKQTKASTKDIQDIKGEVRLKIGDKWIETDAKSLLSSLLEQAGVFEIVMG